MAWNRQQKSPGLWGLYLCLASCYLVILVFIFSVPFIPPSMHVQSSNIKLFAVSKMHYSDFSIFNFGHVLSLSCVKSFPLPFFPKSPLPLPLPLLSWLTTLPGRLPTLPRLDTLYALNKHWINLAVNVYHNVLQLLIYGLKNFKFFEAETHVFFPVGSLVPSPWPCSV